MEKNLAMILEFVVPYVILAVISGFLGANTRIGFWGVFFLSLIFSPIITLLFMLLLKEKPKKGRFDVG